MNKLYLIFIFSILIFSSCKHELETPSWDIDLITPIANSNVSIDQIVIEDSLVEIQSNDSGLVSLFYQSNLEDIDFDSLINIDMIVPGKTERLDSINFPNISISDTISLGELVSTIPLGSILFPNGSNASIPFLPNVINADTFNVNASDYFETMILSDGVLYFEIKNNLPVDISNISCSLVNSSNLNIIASFNFPLIVSGSSAIDSISLAGLSIDKNIEAIINNIDVNASNGNITINYADNLISKISLKNLQITEATAFFPQQELSREITETSFDLGDAQITEIGIKTGIVKISLISTIPDTGRIIYNIPSLKKNGIPFSTEKIVPTTISGESTDYIFDFQDYVLDLTGKDGRIGGDTINTIYSELITYIDSTGELVTLNQLDSFYYFTEFIFSPKYALGYLGTDTVEFGPEIIENNIFNNIVGGNIDLNNTELSVEIDNYFGADANLVFTELTAENTNTGIITTPTVDEDGNNFIGHEYNINRATLINLENANIESSKTSIKLNADEMLSILPDKISTSLNVYLNPNGQSSNPDFLFPEYPIDASIELKVPLNIIANDLHLKDTSDIDIQQNEDLEIDKVYLKVENGFPIDCDFNMILLDMNKNVIDTLFNNQFVSSGLMQNNVVVEKSISILDATVPNFDQIKNVVFDIKFNTDDVNNHVSIYNDYTIDFLLSVKLKTRVN
ncbi:MAG: hypothetical protein ACJ0P8_03340 [Flavobacteriales bacterium]